MNYIFCPFCRGIFGIITLLPIRIAHIIKRQLLRHLNKWYSRISINQSPSSTNKTPNQSKRNNKNSTAAHSIPLLAPTTQDHGSPPLPPLLRSSSLLLRRLGWILLLRRIQSDPLRYGPGWLPRIHSFLRARSNPPCCSLRPVCDQVRRSIT